MNDNIQNDDAPVVFGNITDTGLQRKENQDYYAAVRGEGWMLFVLADGMGGEAAGGLASRLAVDGFVSHIQGSPAEMESGEMLAAALRFANMAVLNRAAEDPSTRGMGTTLDAILIRGDKYRYIHIGDSRVYLYRGGVLRQLTADQTMVQRMVDQGMITEEDAKDHPQRHVLSQVVGKDEDMHPELSPADEELWEGDVFLMCSDGLTDLVSDDEIRDQIEMNDPQAAALELLETALSRGGHDNVTIQVIRKGLPPVRISRPDTLAEPAGAGDTKPDLKVPVPPKGPSLIDKLFERPLLLAAILAGSFLLGVGIAVATIGRDGKGPGNDNSPPAAEGALVPGSGDEEAPPAGIEDLETEDLETGDLGGTGDGDAAE